MKNIAQYIRSRTLAGLLALLPIAITIFLIGQVFSALTGVSDKLAELVPAEKVGYIPVATLITILLILLGCFIIGVIVAPKKTPGAQSWLERKFLNHIPGYSILRSLIFGGLGVQAEGGTQVGLLRREPGVEELVLILGRVGKDRLVVYLPTVPSPASGRLYVVSEVLVEPIPAKVGEALRFYTDWGLDADKIFGEQGSRIVSPDS